MQKDEKVLLLFDVAEPLPLDYDFAHELTTPAWKTEADVAKALTTLGYPWAAVGVHNDIEVIRRKIEMWQPTVLFNLVEEFNRNSALEQHVTAVLELYGVAFTGCGTTGVTLCKHKGISKKILGYHRIRVPNFTVLPKGKRITRPRDLHFPAFIKPLKTEASYGIAQASFVENDDQFKQRVAFIHEKYNQDAIAEEYIPGRELYASILGNDRLQLFPLRELVFREVPDDEPKFASFKAKWDDDYRKRWGIHNEFAEGLDPKLLKRIQHICKKIYRLLAIEGYARLDMRLTPDQELVFIEANPNPHLAQDEDFAESALKAGLAFPALIDRILALGKTAARR